MDVSPLSNACNVGIAGYAYMRRLEGNRKRGKVLRNEADIASRSFKWRRSESVASRAKGAQTTSGVKSAVSRSM